MHTTDLYSPWHQPCIPTPRAETARGCGVYSLSAYCKISYDCFLLTSDFYLSHLFHRKRDSVCWMPASADFSPDNHRHAHGACPTITGAVPLLATVVPGLFLPVSLRHRCRMFCSTISSRIPFRSTITMRSAGCGAVSSPDAMPNFKHVSLSIQSPSPEFRRQARTRLAFPPEESCRSHFTAMHGRRKRAAHTSTHALSLSRRGGEGNHGVGTARA